MPLLRSHDTLVVVFQLTLPIRLAHSIVKGSITPASQLVDRLFQKLLVTKLSEALQIPLLDEDIGIGG